MAEPISISCSADISNLFTRAQHDLDSQFANIDGIDGSWTGLIPESGAFPVGSGGAARVTTMAQQRLSFSRLNPFQPMVGLQADCAVSCDPPTENVNFANADHKWYRLMSAAFNSIPYCLESMWMDALNLSENIQAIFSSMKHMTMDIMDEFYRNNHAGISAFQWMGYVADDGTQSLQRQKWRFATDANGNVDTTYIILDSTIDPDNISLLTVGGVLNRIRNQGTYIGTFPKDGEIPLLTDYETFANLPLYDTNVRADNRFRAPTVLNPAYAATTSYGGYTMRNDPFALRYYWTTTEPGYPAGVLKRIDQWGNNPISEGCYSNVSQDYEDADFQVSFPWGKAAFTLQNGMQPTSAPGGINFAATAAPWRGAWRWVNEVNEITPCNVDRNKGFWRAVFKLAAKPLESGIRGHAVLHRRFPYTGVTKVCRDLGAPVGGSVDCTLTCPPLDWSPPALVDVFVCGTWNPDTCSSVG
jgi:hypothetical protein